MAPHHLAARLPWVLLIAVALFLPAGCSGKDTQAGGIEVIVATSGLRAGVDFDAVEINVQQETGAGAYNELFDTKRLVPSEVTLPTTFSIQAGPSANQEVLITVAAFQNGATAPLVERVAEVQVPSNRVAQLLMVLAADCVGMVTTCATGTSCQPATGACGTNVIGVANLPDYVPGNENLVDAGAGPDATLGTDASADAGDAAGACVPGAICAPGDCVTGVVACEGGTETCVPSGTTTDGTMCDAGAVCFRGSCVVCTAGSDCSEAGSCQASAIACSSGAPACVSEGNAPNGSSCGTGLYCTAGQCTVCTPDSPCVPPGNPCDVGSTTCDDGGLTCADLGTTASNGTPCGTNMVCAGGACTACTTGASCTAPGNTCQTGTTSCASGASTCGSLTNVANGTPCGTNMVCGAGACVTCTSSAACSPGGNTCLLGYTNCSTGSPVCTQNGVAIPGTPCGTDEVCDANGNCGACTEGTSCNPGGNVCQTGTTSCSSGASACANASDVTDGTACGTNMVCSGGQCVSCVANQPCNPTACTVGTTSCASGTSACVNVTNEANGLSCGTDMVCDNGACTACTAGTTCTFSNPCQVGATSCSTGVSACASAGNKTDLTSCSGGVCCSGSCATCSTPANATAACSSPGTCTYACNSGYSACGGGCSNFTDAANCGSCGHSCNGGTCSSGTCQPFVVTGPPTTSTVLDLATDGTHVLWTDSGLGGAYEITVATGTVVTLGSVSGVRGIAVASGYVGVTGKSSSNYPDQLWGFNDDAGLSEEYTGGLARDSGGTMGTFLAVESNAQGLCWIDQFSSMAYVECCPFIGGGGGCGVTQSFSGSPYGAQIAAGATGFYWTDVSSGAVYGVPYGGTSSQVTTLAAAQSSPNMATADATYVYWTTGGTTIVRSTAAGSITSLYTLSSGASAISSMTSDGSTNLHYTFTSGGTGYVGHFSTSVGSASVPTASGTAPTGVVAAGGMVFWFDSATNDIYGLRYP